MWYVLRFDEEQEEQLRELLGMEGTSDEITEGFVLAALEHGRDHADFLEKIWEIYGRWSGDCRLPAEEAMLEIEKCLRG